MNKLTKKELKEQLQILLRTVYCDVESTERAFIDNKVYSLVEDEYVKLNKSGRALLLEKKSNEEFIVKRLHDILSRV